MRNIRSYLLFYVCTTWTLTFVVRQPCCPHLALALPV